MRPQVPRPSRRPGKIAGLAILALAAMALLSTAFAPAASATRGIPLALCKTNEEVCKGEHAYPAGTTFKAEASKGFQFTLSKHSFSCENSSLSLSNAEKFGETIPIDLESFDQTFQSNHCRSDAWACEVTTEIPDSTATIGGENPGDNTLLTGFTVKWHWACYSLNQLLFSYDFRYQPPATQRLTEGSPAAIDLAGGNVVCVSGPVCGTEEPEAEIVKGNFKFVSPEPIYVTEGNPIMGTNLCKSESINGPNYCGKANRYPAGTQLSAKLKSGTLLTIATKEPYAGTIECTESTLSPQTSSAIGEPLGLEAAGGETAWTVSSTCKRTGKEQTCNVKVTSANKATLAADDSVGNGSLAFEEWKLYYECVTILGTIKCELSPTAPATVERGATPSIEMKSISMKKVGGNSLCSKVNTLNASYALTSPTPLYVSDFTDEY